MENILHWQRYKKINSKDFWRRKHCRFCKQRRAIIRGDLKNSLLRKIVFFCGNKRLQTIPEKLANNGIAVEEVIVYETIETAANIKKQYDGILFYSPSAVQSFFKKILFPIKQNYLQLALPLQKQ